MYNTAHKFYMENSPYVTNIFNIKHKYFIKKKFLCEIFNFIIIYRCRANFKLRNSLGMIPILIMNYLRFKTTFIANIFSDSFSSSSLRCSFAFIYLDISFKRVGVLSYSNYVNS